MVSQMVHQVKGRGNLDLASSGLRQYVHDLSGQRKAHPRLIHELLDIALHTVTSVEHINRASYLGAMGEKPKDRPEMKWAE